MHPETSAWIEGEIANARDILRRGFATCRKDEASLRERISLLDGLLRTDVEEPAEVFGVTEQVSVGYAGNEGLR